MFESQSPISDTESNTHSISLNGEWEFRIDGEKEWRTISVPGCWESQISELQGWGGVVFYRKKAVIPDDWKDKVVLIDFSAVDYWTSLLINGFEIGNHRGGYLGFKFEIQHVLEFGAENLIEVTVADASPTQDVELPDGSGTLRFVEIPHGKQSWYSTVGGIWGSVTIYAKSKPSVERVHITPDFNSHKLTADIFLSHPPQNISDLFLLLTVYDPVGNLIFLETNPLNAGAVEYSFIKILEEVLPWSPKTPNLYELKVSIQNSSEEFDCQHHKFGFRKFEARGKKLYLNNEPFYLIAALDQDFYPTTIYTPPSREYLRKQFIQAKEMGLNCMRCHIKIPEKSYLELCDELGLLVWYEIPNVALLNEEARKNVVQTFDGMLLRDHNHPCIVILTLFNESWGIDLTQREQRDFLKKLYEESKLREPNRLIVDNSACIGNFHLEGDLADYHYYYQIPDHADSAKKWLEEFVNRAPWIYSPYGDAVPHNEPLIVSEWGNWGLPELAPILEEAGNRDPWWFKAGFGNLRPEGILERFSASPLSNVFNNFDELARWTQIKQFEDMKWQIEEMRLRPEIVGYVITEFQDIDWEVNGMIDFLRRPKVPLENYSQLQQEDLLILRPNHYAFKHDEQIELQIWLSHLTNQAINNAELKIYFDDELIHSEKVKNLSEDNGCFLLLKSQFSLPNIIKTDNIKIKAQLKVKDTIAAETFQTVLISSIKNTSRKFVWRDPLVRYQNKDLFSSVQNIEIEDKLTAEKLLVTTLIDETAKQHISSGGRVLLIASDGRSIPKGSSISLAERTESGRWGDWCSAFIWFSDSVFGENVPDINSWDFRFQQMIPKRVVLGLSTEDYKRDALAGLFVGWLRSEGAIALQAKCGDGCLLITTLDCIRRIDSDPMSELIFTTLCDYTESCAPAIEVNFSNMLTLISTAEDQVLKWKYKFDAPGTGWNALDYQDDTWLEGDSAFGKRTQPYTQMGTLWTTSDVWMRKKFNFDGASITDGHLRLQHDEDCQVYLNGVVIFDRPGFLSLYEDEKLSREALNLLQKGENVLAVHCHQSGGDQYIDVGLYVTYKE